MVTGEIRAGARFLGRRGKIIERRKPSWAEREKGKER